MLGKHNLFTAGLFALCALQFTIVAGAETKPDSSDAAATAAEFDSFLKPLFAKSCTKCHGEKKVKGKVNLKEIATAEQFLAEPELIKALLDVIESEDMPPEDEPQLEPEKRLRLVASLKKQLARATAGSKTREMAIRRLNRLQYNNAVRDLFRLDRDVFKLPEKLMTRRGDYLDPKSSKMPDSVEVACLSLDAPSGLRGVNAFPKDLRAAHGFDNQANQLTLSPLLLDTYLKLGVSVLESPDFNPDTVGIWDEFFKEPAADAEISEVIKRRLTRFLEEAFRGRVDEATVARYSAYVGRKMDQGASFTEGMKKVASAALCSPLFLFRYRAAKKDEDQFALASNLAFFLWGSGPDAALLNLAKRGELSRPSVLNETIDRMLSDRKMERFLDIFPVQWMQLENILAATPDPGKHRFFSLDKTRPASMHMVLEPLLLFDAIFLEDRSIVELISPSFSYRSDFLRTWYGSDLKPPKVDQKKVEEINRANDAQRKAAEGRVKEIEIQIAALHGDLERRIEDRLKTTDIGPGQAAWEKQQQEILAEKVALSTWQSIGPFGAKNFDEAYAKDFIGEESVDLEKSFGKQNWSEAKQHVDGKVHELKGADTNCATYLYRSIQSSSARSLEVSLGSDDGFKIWLNGKCVSENKVIRGVAPDQEKIRLDLLAGENSFLLKVVNGGGGYAFYFKTESLTDLSAAMVSALSKGAAERTEEQKNAVASHYRSIAPEFEDLRNDTEAKRANLNKILKQRKEDLGRVPRSESLEQHRERARRRFDDEMRNKLRSQRFDRVATEDPRYGGVITNAAMLSMTSGPKRTHPIARGAWVIEVIFNDPPPPPPNDVPPLNEDSSDANLTIREKFAKHRENPDCAGCHTRLDPLGFALENFDITGRWRDKYENGRDVDASGAMLKKYKFDDIVEFKTSLVQEKRRFAKAFVSHLLRFALSRELSPADSLIVEKIVSKTERNDFKLKSVIREVILSESFLGLN